MSKGRQSPQAKKLAERRSKRYRHIQLHGRWAVAKCRRCASKRYGRSDCRFDGVGTACNVCVTQGKVCSFTKEKWGRQGSVDRQGGLAGEVANNAMVAPDVVAIDLGVAAALPMEEVVGVEEVASVVELPVSRLLTVFRCDR